MLIQDEKDEEAKVLRDINRPHPGLHGLLKKEKGNDEDDEGTSLLGGSNGDHDKEEDEEDGPTNIDLTL